MQGSEFNPPPAQGERVSKEMEEFVIAGCLNNDYLLAHAMSSLTSHRDFTGENQKAFAVLEGEFLDGNAIDPLVVAEKLKTLGIYEDYVIRDLITTKGTYKGFEEKVSALRRLGGLRMAQDDIYELNRMIRSDIDPAKLASHAWDMAASWTSGDARQYKTASEVMEEFLRGDTGEQLLQNVPLLDEVLYKNGGNRKGQVKATILREKHGKTRHACWDASHDLALGRKVLYITTEGQSHEITGNFIEIFQDRWKDVEKNLVQLDRVTDVMEIASAMRDFALFDDGDKVVIDHLQRIEWPNGDRLSENEKGNRCCKLLTDYTVRFNINTHILNQARQPQMGVTGWKSAPDVYDCYGSNQLVKDAYLILTGFRPGLHDELIMEHALAEGGKSARGPNGEPVPLTSMFIRPVRSRKKMPYLYQWAHFVDTDEGLKLHRQELL